MHAAVEADRLIKTPCRGIKLPDRPELDRHMLDAAQLSLLAAAAGPDYEPLIWLGALLGLRWGECAGLRVGRIDFLHLVEFQAGARLLQGVHEAARRRQPDPEAVHDPMGGVPDRALLTASLAAQPPPVPSTHRRAGGSHDQSATDRDRDQAGAARTGQV